MSVGCKQTDNTEPQQAYAHLYAAPRLGVFLFWVTLTLLHERRKEGECHYHHLDSPGETLNSIVWE